MWRRHFVEANPASLAAAAAIALLGDAWRFGFNPVHEIYGSGFLT